MSTVHACRLCLLFVSTYNKSVQHAHLSIEAPIVCLNIGDRKSEEKQFRQT